MKFPLRSISRCPDWLSSGKAADFGSIRVFVKKPSQMHPRALPEETWRERLGVSRDVLWFLVANGLMQAVIRRPRADCTEPPGYNAHPEHPVYMRWSSKVDLRSAAVQEALLEAAAQEAEAAMRKRHDNDPW